MKPEEVPKTYEDLLRPRWKGKLAFDTVADYVLAALEDAWGKEKALEYMRKMKAQQPTFYKGHTLETQLVAGGEHPIAIEINSNTAAVIRDKGAPIAIRLLRPYISKPHGLFLAKNAPHPHAAILFHDWLLSAEGQAVWGKTLGRAIARKDVAVRYSEFQIDPDYVLIPETYANRKARKRFSREFREIFELPQ